MKEDRASNMKKYDMMKNFEFLDHNECILEMQIFTLLFSNYLTNEWE
jgi:hypothetical protein